jgi:hypothetical protein
VAVALRELVGIQSASHMLATEDVADRIAIGVGGAQAPVLRVMP